uniref:tRNA 2'-phosphotransferase n=1 Tax=Runella slithyformis TaxID=106 RepID=UPI001CEFB15C|nr:Chain A, tRNA 2'-phosphotransferase [Runella slithyformis]7KW9_A Chain A, tRNA 2'-phosphotransferase [Runella slithyformis]
GSHMVKVSKFLSLVLRHNPALIGLDLDANGWAPVKELLAKMKAKGHGISMEELKHIVETNSKKRFAFSENFEKIRANQGHSVEVDLGYEKQVPPAVLFHGTAEKNFDLILKDGIKKMSRHHVHLSQDITTARKVGMRHGKPVVLSVDAKGMADGGFDFYLSNNGVWLIDFVPAEFIKV